MRPEDFFERLWEGYATVAPRAATLRRSLEARGEAVLNDHVAVRTFGASPIDIEHLEPRILELGYRVFEDYNFVAKSLSARAYVYDPYPRIFLSELKREQLSQPTQATLQSLVQQIPTDAASDTSVFWSGCLWEPISWQVYEQLAAESEYAGWLSAMGMCANHFTVHVNALKTFRDLDVLLDWVEAQGFPLNLSGGRVKGDPSVLLCQGSTLADRKEVHFADGFHTIPTCYYEFAQRFPQSDGQLYNGFVAASADSIFESTHR